MTQKELITNKAVEFLDKEPRGLRCSELKRLIKQELPDVKEAALNWTIPNLHLHRPNEVYKPDRGLFRHIKFRETVVDEGIQDADRTKQGVTEQQFYGVFAAYLMNDLEECTKAIPLGGNRFKDRWGTPDVVGILAPRPSDILQFHKEIISAEIKAETSALITAFGQACSYRLFSHKVYLVVPGSASESDLARLDALCRVFGLGLVLFDVGNAEEPNFQIRVRATKHEPDMFYANKNVKLIEDELFG